MKKKLAQFSIVILLLSSCATSRKVQVIQDALSKRDSINALLNAEKTKVDSGLIVKDIVEKITSTKLSFNTMNAHIKVDYQTLDRSDAFITNISIEKGKVIYITARGAMGVIGLKAKITNDSVLIYYPLSKKVEKRPLSYLQEIFKIPITYTILEDLIVGNPIFVENSDIVNYKVNNSKLQVSMAGKLFKNLITLSEDNSKVLHLKLDDINVNQNRTCDISYSDHVATIQNQFSMSRDIAISSQSRIEIHMEVKDYTFDDPLKYTFVIPKQGKRK
ncbi:MAG: hypothetical protein RI940_674 [Bacteroidota bacterium]